MDKPNSMSLKEYLIRLMSIRTNKPLKTIEAVVNHQFESANEALKSNFTIELSGFGKVLFNHKKAQKKWEKNISKKKYFENLLTDPNLTEQKLNSTKLKLENTIKWMDQIKPKIENDKHQRIIRGMEEQINTSKGDEIPNRADLSGENGDM